MTASPVPSTVPSPADVSFGELPDLLAGATRVQGRGRTLRELLEEGVPTSPAPLVGLAFASRLTLLAGREKSGKSTLATYHAAKVSEQGGLVAWVALDEPVIDAVRRLHEMGADQDRTYIFDDWVEADPLGDAHGTLADLSAGDFQLIVIDHLGKLAERSPEMRAGMAGDSVLWGRLVSPLVSLAHSQGGPAILLLSQASKGTGEYVNSTAIGAAADVLATIEEREGRRILRSRGRFALPEYHVEFADGHLTLRLRGDNQGPIEDRVHGRPVPSSDIKILLTHLEDADPERLTSGAWFRLVFAEGWSRSRYNRARKVAFNQGLISHSSRKYLVTARGKALLGPTLEEVQEENPSDEPPF